MARKRPEPLIPLTIGLTLSIIIGIVVLILTLEPIEHYSELYYPQSQELPLDIYPGMNYSFNITINSHEAAPESYILQTILNTYHLHDLTEGTYDCLSKYRRQIRMEWQVGNKTDTLYQPANMTAVEENKNITWEHYYLTYTYRSLGGKGTLTLDLNDTSIIIDETQGKIRFTTQSSQQSEDYPVPAGETQQLTIEMLPDEAIVRYTYNKTSHEHRFPRTHLGTSSISFTSEDAYFTVNDLTVRKGEGSTHDLNHVIEYNIDEGAVYEAYAKVQAKRIQQLHLLHKMRRTIDPIFKISYPNNTYPDTENPFLEYDLKAIDNNSNNTITWKDYSITYDIEGRGASESAMISGDYDWGIILSRPTESVLLFSRGEDGDLLVLKHPYNYTYRKHKIHANVTGDNLTLLVDNKKVDSIIIPQQDNEIWFTSKDTIPFVYILKVNDNSDECKDRDYYGKVCEKYYTIDQQPRYGGASSIRDFTTSIHTSTIAKDRQKTALEQVLAEILSGGAINATGKVRDENNIYKQLNITAENPLIPDKDLIFDGSQARIYNWPDHEFFYDYNILEGSEIVRTTFYDEQGNEIVQHIIHQKMNKSYLLHEGNIIEGPAMSDNGTWNRVWFTARNNTLTITLNRKHVIFTIQNINMSRGYYAIGTTNTYANFRWAGIDNLATGARKEFALSENPCQLNKIGEEELQLGTYLLNPYEQQTVQITFTAPDGFDYGLINTSLIKKSAINQSLHTHFWVINR